MTSSSASPAWATLNSSVGACFPGERAVFRGHDLHRDLSHSDWMDVFVFGITGRRHTPQQIRLLHAIWVNTSYPDARLWNNRVAALAGSSRSSANLALSAALATSEAAIYGRQIDLAVADFLVRTEREQAQGTPLADLVRQELHHNRSIGGYGRPVARSAADERNAVVIGIAKQLGLANGKYLQLAHAVEEVLRHGRWRMRMNYGAIAAALALDLGLSPQEYYVYMFNAFLAGMPPCYLEALEKPARSTFTTPCTALSYHGPAKRGWNPPADR